jgi:hypothetical protein
VEGTTETEENGESIAKYVSEKLAPGIVTRLTPGWIMD